jgi:uncharacterized protein (TIGR03382 family)
MCADRAPTNSCLGCSTGSLSPFVLFGLALLARRRRAR